MPVPRTVPDQAMQAPTKKLLLGDDWVRPEGMAEAARRGDRSLRARLALFRSPLARKIALFNLSALVVLLAGVLLSDPFRDTLVVQRKQGLMTEARLVAAVFEARGAVPTAGQVAPMMDQLSLAAGDQLFLFDRHGQLLGQKTGQVPRADADGGRALIGDALTAASHVISGIFSAAAPAYDAKALVAGQMAPALQGQTVVASGPVQGGAVFAVATPVRAGEEIVAVVGLASAEGEIDRLVRNEREQVLQMFLLAVMVSLGLSVVLAATIANPLADLASAAELGLDRDGRKTGPGRVRIPDLAARPDEIGRLSMALRGLVTTLYDRIDANEQFAADVTHEVKNPLASLRSAVGTLRLAQRPDALVDAFAAFRGDVDRRPLGRAPSDPR